MSEGNFEAKVSAKRETSSGIFLTLQIQPDDYTADLATLRVGSALVIGWAEVVDTGVHTISTEAIKEGDVTEWKITTKPTKERKPFDSLPLSQQAALRCQDVDFGWYLMDRFPKVSSDAPTPADVVRDVCGVKSRAELDIKDSDGCLSNAAIQWVDLEARYHLWLVDKRYKDSRR